MITTATMQSIVSIIEKDIEVIYGIPCKGYLDSQGMGITIDMTTKGGSFSFFINVRDFYDMNEKTIIDNISLIIANMRKIFVPKSDVDELLEKLQKTEQALNELKAVHHQLHDNINFHYRMTHGKQFGED